MCYVSKQVDDHCEQLGNDDAREQAIESLAEHLSSAASLGVSNFLRLSRYDFSYKNINNLTNGSDEYNEMFYKIAEKLIDSQEGWL